MAGVQELRKLGALAHTASTARVMNLARRPTAGARSIRPLFDNPVLDRSIIVKHRLRPHERQDFVTGRGVVTKVLIPLDPDNLNIGAHAFMVGERGWRGALQQLLGLGGLGEAEPRDLRVLAALDELPTLDPFLTREHLKRREIFADDDYFELSPADAARMFAFVQEKIVPLVTLCFGDRPNADAQARRLAQKILAADMDASMNPLRTTLKMDEPQFLESIFCWKGFLYYKWVLADSLRDVQAVAAEVGAAKARGKATPEEAAYISGARARLQEGVRKVCREVKMSLDRYDRAFEALTEHADPVAFRDFLMDAPTMFFSVGDRLGGVQHITSFWRYRMDADRPALTPPELGDILLDFEQSLGLAGDRDAAWR